MTINSSTGESEATKVDTAASAACTRSGAFALALAIVIALLIPAWLHRQKEDALSRYAAYRFDLSLTLDQLDHDPYWQELKVSNKAIETTSFSKLPTTAVHTETFVPPSNGGGVDADHDTPATTTTVFGPPAVPGPQPPSATAPAVTIPTGSKPKGAQGTSTLPSQPAKRSPNLRIVPAAPSAPTLTSIGFTDTIEIPELTAIRDALNHLNDSELLTESRGNSTFYSISISRWSERRSELIYRNAVLHRCDADEIEEPSKNKTDIPAIVTGALLGCLTLSDLRELAAFEEPAISPDPIGGGTGREIEISPGALPRDLYAASLVAEALFMFVIVYFGAFAREAMASNGFPAPGTLFSAFSRSRLTLLTMFLAFLMPVASSVGLALVSRKTALWAGSLLILLAVFTVFVEFRERSYFSTLSPLKWVRRNAISARKLSTASGKTDAPASPEAGARRDQTDSPTPAEIKQIIE